MKFQSVDDKYGSAVYNIENAKAHVRSMREAGFDEYSLSQSWGETPDGIEYATLLDGDGTLQFVEVNETTIAAGLVIDLGE